MPFQPALTIDRPTVDDGAALWRIARDSRVLDLNSPYSYLLWCRDFADTSAVARHEGEPVAFVTGYLRPDRPGTLFVWQIAVDDTHQGRGLAGALLDALTVRVAASRVETTITSDNSASRALFASYAARHGAGVEETVLFDDELFPGDGHEPEVLHRIGPLAEPPPTFVWSTRMTTIETPMSTFELLESEVRSYCRGWPVVFDQARGSRLWSEDGRRYLDFFAGAGSLNYGHNNPVLKRALLDYLENDGITHGLDMATTAKRAFLESFHDLVLKPRGLPYKVMFPGPTGTNAVESALKLARKAKGRESVVSFTNAFHGMTLGSLAVTGNAFKRAGAGIPLVHGTPMPFDDYLDGQVPDFLWFERLLADTGSGLNHPAAVIVETVQGEGGINVARPEWLRGLATLCERHDMLLIVDDIQMGCGRTGSFFSFEEAGITPDIVTVSKSISGYGLPMALTLFKPELDLWEPGEHNGTFRGNNPAFVTATAALHAYWADKETELRTALLGEQVEQRLLALCAENAGASCRGRGLVWGVEFEDPERASEVCARAFERGLLLETSGPQGEVVKLLPALTVSEAELDEGLDILERAVRASG